MRICRIPAFPPVRNLDGCRLPQGVIGRGTINNLYGSSNRAVVINPFRVCHGQADTSMGTCGSQLVKLPVGLGRIVAVPVIPYRMEQHAIDNTGTVLPIAWPHQRMPPQLLAGVECADWRIRAGRADKRPLWRPIASVYGYHICAFINLQCIRACCLHVIFPEKHGGRQQETKHK